MSPDTLAPAATPAFNTWLHNGLRALADDLQRALRGDLTALVLAGGFGRGDGSITLRNGLERPYNDLDFIVVVRRRRARHAAILARIGEAHGKALGVEVEFGRPITEQEIQRWPRWLLWHDIAHGHIVVSGPGDIVRRNAPAAIAGPPPRVEAARLLLNRGAGLLRALNIAHGAEPAPDPDFIVRNAHKCAQAIGDAWLIGAGAYAPSLAERHARLQGLLDGTTARDAAVLRWHSLALQFRACPDRPAPGTGGLAALRELSDLWLHVFAAVAPCPDAERARTWLGVREPEEHHWRHWPRNVVRSLQTRALSIRHPRERLYELLPRLLAAPAPTDRWSGLAAHALAVWARVH